MKKNILIVVAGFLMLFFLNGVCCCGNEEIMSLPYASSYIELSGLQYNKVKIELSEFSENISEFYDADIQVRQFYYYADKAEILKILFSKPLKGYIGTSLTINNKKIDMIECLICEPKYSFKNIRVEDIIRAKKPILIHADITKLRLHHPRILLNLKLYFEGFEESIGRTYSYRLKVDTDGLKANKNLFDKKIQFTPENSGTHIRIDIANKKVDIKY